MKINRSMLVMDDRAVLVEGITMAAQYTYPELSVSTGPEGLQRLCSGARPTGRPGESLVLVLGGSALAGLPESQQLLSLIGCGASVVAIVGGAGSADVHTLRAAGVSIFVCASEGINELLRGMEQAFENETHLSPDAEVLFSRPSRIAPRISPRERQIALLYLSENDWSVDDVSGMLQISSQTVRSHLARLRSHFTAAGFTVRNRLELRQALVEIGALDEGPEPLPYVLPVIEHATQASHRFRFSEGSAPSTKVG